MKKFIALILAAVLVMSLAACVVEASMDPQTEEPARFICVDRFGVDSDDTGTSDFGKIYVDVETGVTYAFLYTGRSGAGFVTLLNTDGTPMIWEGYE